MKFKLPKKQIRAVFSDLDDTLTERSHLFPATYESLWRLKEAGFWLVIVSGRPAGWADFLMRLWPIDAMIFENGAGLITREGMRLKVETLARDKNIEEQKRMLSSLFEGLKGKIPDLKLASDQPYRLFDFAIDYHEETPFLTDDQVRFLMQELSKTKGITAKLSSIHINYWCGTHTKVTACDYLLKRYGQEHGITPDQVVFCGDSPNDEPLFAYFPHTVGVANIRQFLNTMKTPPGHITEGAGGKGFQELAAQLLQ